MRAVFRELPESFFLRKFGSRMLTGGR